MPRQSRPRRPAPRLSLWLVLPAMLLTALLTTAGGENNAGIREAELASTNPSSPLCQVEQRANEACGLMASFKQIGRKSCQYELDSQLAGRGVFDPTHTCPSGTDVVSYHVPRHDPTGSVRGRITHHIPVILDQKIDKPHGACQFTVIMDGAATEHWGKIFAAGKWIADIPTTTYCASLRHGDRWSLIVDQYFTYNAVGWWNPQANLGWIGQTDS